LSSWQDAIKEKEARKREQKEKERQYDLQKLKEAENY
jgi:hypothetical protein